MRLRLRGPYTRVLVSGLALVALIAGVATTVFAQRGAASSAHPAPRVIASRMAHGAFRSGEVNLATLAPVKLAVAARPAPKAIHTDRLRKTAAQQAAYRQWALTHPNSLPHATSVGRAAGGVQPNIYGGGAYPVLLSKGAGLTSNDGGGYYPPDQAIAAAPGYIFEGVNNVMEVYSTTYGTKFGPWTPDVFFASVMKAGDTFSDPQITFDAERSKYLISWLEIDSTGYDYLDIAISKGSTPSPLTAFHVYQVPATTTGPDDFCDYDTLGYDYWGMYVTCVTFSVSSGLQTGNATYDFDINKMLAGSVVVATQGTILTTVSCGTGCLPAYRLSPTMEDGVPQAEWITATDVGWGATSSNLTVCALTNTHALDSGNAPYATCSNATLPVSYDDSMFAAQPGTATGVYPGDGYKQVAFRNGQLYFALPEAVNCGGVTHDGILYLAVTPQLGTLASHSPQASNGIVANYTQSGVFCVAATDVYMPALVAGTEGDMTLVFNYSSSTAFPSIGYTGRTTADAPGSMGQNAATNWGTVVAGTNSNDSARWGDYSACALTTNLVTRGIVYCGGEFGGPNTALGGFGWDTELYGIRME